MVSYFLFDSCRFTKLQRGLDCIIFPRPSTQLSLTAGRFGQWEHQLPEYLLQAACSKIPGPGLKLAMLPFGTG